jgi:hypothetical protein
MKIGYRTYELMYASPEARTLSAPSAAGRRPSPSNRRDEAKGMVVRTCLATCSVAGLPQPGSGLISLAA